MGAWSAVEYSIQHAVALADEPWPWTRETIGRANHAIGWKNFAPWLTNIHEEIAIAMHKDEIQPVLQDLARMPPALATLTHSYVDDEVKFRDGW